MSEYYYDSKMNLLNGAENFRISLSVINPDGVGVETATFTSAKALLCLAEKRIEK